MIGGMGQPGEQPREDPGAIQVALFGLQSIGHGGANFLLASSKPNCSDEQVSEQIVFRRKTAILWMATSALSRAFSSLFEILI